MHTINKIIPEALKALRDTSNGLLLPDGKSILKEYDGYVASFAPSVITAGLIATLSFYADAHKDDGENKAPRRSHVLSVIEKIYAVHTGRTITLLEYAIDHKNDRQLRRDLIHIATALKLAMRNFRQAKDKNDLLTAQTQTP